VSSFDEALALVLKHEGSYVNDIRDPGGETKYGISKRAYPSENIKALTVERATEIYRRDYWNACGCDKLPPGLALCVFDAAVNQGAGFARIALQEICGVKMDGVIGDATIKAANKDPRAAVARFMARRAQRYATNKNVALYGAGWFARLIDVTLEAAKWIERKQ
jgi:lysozyme family protein